MTHIHDTLLSTCRRYWQLRCDGDLIDARIQAHNDVLSLFDALNIPYQSREHAVQIVGEILAGCISYETFVSVLDATAEYHG